MPAPDAIVVGSGPNGLAAAITLARVGVSVLVLEAEPTVGGGARSAELTLPGFTHDICSAIHPFACASPFFRKLPLEQFGLNWIHSPAPLGHPFDGGRALVVEHSMDETTALLGEDAHPYRRLLRSPTAAWNVLRSGRSPLAAAPELLPGIRTGISALQSAAKIARRNFRRPLTQALFAGFAAHAMLPLEKAGTAGVALALLSAAHAGGWPFPRGGAQRISDALAAYLRSLGGRIETGHRITHLGEVISARAVLLDLTPRQVLAIAEPLLPPTYAGLLRRYRYGLAAFKMDWALSQPVPWRSPELRRCATLHLGGSIGEIAGSERTAWQDKVPERPFLIAAQPSLFDPSRAPQGRHTLWAYCHVPNGSEIDMTGRMEAQIERFAPGFRDCILARSVLPPRALEARNANLVGGDIAGGAPLLSQLLVRPTLRYWKTPLPNVYLCSSSTPPGVGVHGMCGYIAARIALKRLRAA